MRPCSRPHLVGRHLRHFGGRPSFAKGRAPRRSSWNAPGAGRDRLDVASRLPSCLFPQPPPDAVRPTPSPPHPAPQPPPDAVSQSLSLCFAPCQVPLRSSKRSRRSSTSGRTCTCTRTSSRPCAAAATNPPCLASSSQASLPSRARHTSIAGPGALTIAGAAQTHPGHQSFVFCLSRSACRSSQFHHLREPQSCCASLSRGARLQRARRCCTSAALEMRIAPIRRRSHVVGAM